MVTRIVLHCFLAIVATGVGFSFAAPNPPLGPDGIFQQGGELAQAFQYFAHTDTDKVLASHFPHVPPEQRRNIGVVPKNLFPLIQGADDRGRLVIPAPRPGHALLLTKSVPDKKPLFGPALLYTNTPNDPIHMLTETGEAGKDTVKGLGAFTDADGKVHYFRTIPFDPVFRKEGQEFRLTESTNHIPPRDRKKGLFEPRPITLNLPDGTQHRSKDKILLPHVSVVPQSGFKAWDLRIYPQPILDEVLKGPPKELRKQKEGVQSFVQWSDTPNWSRKERHAKIAGDGTSSPRWIQKLKSPFTRSRSGSRLLRGSDEASSSSGSSRGGALVRSA